MPEHIYLTGVGIAGYLLLCVPLALFITWTIYRHGLRRLATPVLRWMGVAVTGTFLLSFPLWDVIAISLEADKLCREQAGLKVYRRVAAEGFVGGSIEYWSRFGFSYTENGAGDTIRASALGRHTMMCLKERRSGLSMDLLLERLRLGHVYPRFGEDHHGTEDGYQPVRLPVDDRRPAATEQRHAA